MREALVVSRRYVREIDTAPPPLNNHTHSRYVCTGAWGVMMHTRRGEEEKREREKEKTKVALVRGSLRGLCV